MIKIEVEGYCHNCLDFEPDVIKPDRVYTGFDEYVWGDTMVRCEYRKRCAAIKRYLDQQSNSEYKIQTVNEKGEPNEPS